MPKYFKWIIVLFLFPLACFAQSNYKTGYIINLKNDTVKGYVDYREWINNPKSFYFKSSLDDNTPRKFSTVNVKAFAVTNLAYYQKAIVKISAGNVNVGSLPGYIDTSYIVDTVFLKMVSSGKNLVLYSLSEPAKIHFYLADNAEISELNYYMYMDNSSVRVINTFQNQLAAIAAIYKPNQNAIVEQIKRAGYTEYDIKNIVKSINDGEDKTYNPENLSKVQFFAGTGVNANKITFNGSNGPFPAGTNSSSTLPILSGGINFIVNKNTQRVMLRLEVAAAFNQYSFAESTPTELKTSATLDIKQLNIAVIPQVIYNFYSTKKLKAFVDAGVALNLSFYNNYNYISYYFDKTSVAQNKYPSFNKGWPSFPLKAGIFLNDNVEIYGTYWLPASVISSNGSFGANITSFQVGINFML
jgi:hypothetical protein